MKSYKEYVQEELDTDPELKGPFCPFNSPGFGHGYCNDAYTQKCFDCRESKAGYVSAHLSKKK